MTAPLVADYSFADPDPKALKGAGYVGVMRYLSMDASKNLTAGEAQKLHAAGLWVGLVWETVANRAAQGRVAGHADAATANRMADQLGYPKTAVLYYAVDFDASPEQVTAYFAGVKAEGGRPFGIYGGIKVTTAGLAPYRWQACAWSGGKVDPAANLYQRIQPTHPVPGCDENVLMHTFPVWLPPGVKPAPKPPTKAAPKWPTPAEQAARNIQTGVPIRRVKRPKVKALMASIIRRLRRGLIK